MVRTALSLFISTMAAILMLSGLASTALAAQGPQSFTLDGRVKQAGSSNPLLDTNLQIRVYILNPTRTCILYAETQTVDTNSSSGYFNIQVGSTTVSAKRIGGSDPGLTMRTVYENRTAKTGLIAYPGQTCAANTYTPAANDSRFLRIVVVPSATGTPETLTPDTVLDAVPMAIVAEQAESIQGFQADDLLKVNTTGVSLSQANLESVFTGAAWTNVQDIMAGNFTPRSSTGATTLPTYPTASPPATPSAGSIWYDSDTNQVKYYDGTATQIVGNSGSGLSGVSVSANLTVNGTASTAIVSSSTIDLNDTGVTAGTYPKVTVDAKGRVTGGASLLEADIPTLSTAGKVSGDAITSGTIGGTTAVNTSGTIATSGTVSANSLSGRALDLFDADTNYIRFQAPPLAGNYTLTFPADDGTTAGQMLTTDGSGNLTWTTPASAGITALTGDVTATGPGSAAATIADGAVTFAKMQDIQTSRLLGRSTALPGDVEELLVGTGLSLVGGTLSVSSSLQNAFVQDGNSFGDAATLGTNDANVLNFETNNSTRMSIDTSGNVGIGTTGPDALLHIDDPVTNTYATSSGSLNAPNGTVLNIQNSNAANNKFSGLKFESTNSGGTNGTAYIGVLSTSTATQSPIVIGQRTGFGTYSERVRVSPTGNVGIGETSPTRKLHVNGPMRLMASTTPASPAAGDIFIDSAASNALKYYNGSAWVSLTGGGGTPGGSTTQVQFNNAGAFAGDANFVWDNSNKWLGIGKNPSVPLDIQIPAGQTDGLMISGGTWDDASMTLQSATSAGRAGIILSSNSNSEFQMFVDDVTTNFYLNPGSNWNSPEAGSAIFTPSGELGLKTTPAAGRVLHVNGPMRLTASTTPASPAAGDIFIDSAASNALKYYNGTAWVSLTGGGGDFKADGSVSMTGNLQLNTNYLSNDGTNTGLVFLNNSSARMEGSTGSGVVWGIRNTSSASGSGSVLRFSNASVTTGQVEMVVGATTADNTMIFSSRGSGTLTERMRIDPTGNVGIGETSPSRLLHVAGPMRLTASTTPASPAAGDIFIDSAASNALKYYNGTAWVSLTGGGTGDFMANGSVPMTGDLQLDRYITGGNSSNVIDTGSSASDPLVLRTSSTDIQLRTINNNDIYFTTNNNERMRITQTGNVGIGTTAPSTRLHVIRSSADTAATFANTANGVAISASTGSGTAISASGGSGFGVSASSTNRAVNVTGSNGGTGVHVSAAPNSGSNFGLGIYTTLSGANTGYALQAVNNSASGWGVYSSGTSPNYFAGNVGIGTTSPASALEVNGRMVAGVATDADALSSLTVSFASANMIRATGASAACGTLNFTDVAAGGSFTVTILNATATCTAIQLNGATTNVKLPSGYTGGTAAAGLVYTAIYDGTTLWVSYVPF